MGPSVVLPAAAEMGGIVQQSGKGRVVMGMLALKKRPLKCCYQSSEEIFHSPVKSSKNSV